MSDVLLAVKGAADAYGTTATGDLLREAAAEITRLRKEREWRTMDSAPRDGTPVLVWFRNRCHVAEYGPVLHPDNKCWFVREPATGVEEKACLVAVIDPPTMGGNPIPGTFSGPSHWQPLPAPPSSQDDRTVRP